MSNYIEALCKFGNKIEPVLIKAEDISSMYSIHNGDGCVMVTKYEKYYSDTRYYIVKEQLLKAINQAGVEVLCLRVPQR